MTVPTQKEMRRALERRQGRELVKKLSESTVAVCGLGGLGSNISISLARAGVGRLILIDFDRVDVTNLHRQQYKADQIGMCKTDALAGNLLEIAPYIRLTRYSCRISPDNLERLLADADVICEAFDDPEAKAMLAEGALQKLPEKYLVAASGMAGLGPANDIQTRQVTERFWLCGDGVSDVADGNGLFSTRVMLCAAHQAHAVLRILAGEN
ncbi:MAG: thiamine biosynthesis protein ThiF [Clostridiales bacterium]|nr:thiamine biosynthesis protein ThiF [Clostridiales bacterium]